MKSDRRNAVLKSILEKIELPDSAYEKAEKRYTDIGEWFHRPESTCLDYDPHVFSQGSFRLGTAIRPDHEEEYDLDMGCNLRQGLTKTNVTQKQLKTMVGVELEKYRRFRGIKEDMAEKRRCWRLEYADDLSFHMDIVPCIPETGTRRGVLKERMMLTSGLDESLAGEISDLAVSITDKDDANYSLMSDDWRISNPEGYAHWFASRMRIAANYLAERQMMFTASIDTLPYYQWKTPLQSLVQLLKRHRDTMFGPDDESKPISIIITTLAARAYNGESDIVSAITNILARMDRYINAAAPYVPNPVNPEEDFADKWYSPDHEHLQLPQSFSRWLTRARQDFAALCLNDNARLINETAARSLQVNLDQRNIEKMLGLSAAVVTPPRIHISDAARPWGA